MSYLLSLSLQPLLLVLIPISMNQIIKLNQFLIVDLNKNIILKEFLKDEDFKLNLNLFKGLNLFSNQFNSNNLKFIKTFRHFQFFIKLGGYDIGGVDNDIGSDSDNYLYFTLELLNNDHYQQHQQLTNKLINDVKLYLNKINFDHLSIDDDQSYSNILNDLNNLIDVSS